MPPVPDDQIHPDLLPLLLARRGITPGRTVAEKREVWRRYSAAIAEPAPADMAIHDRPIPVGGREVQVRVYRPAGVPDGAPCVIYMHGGAFLLGDLDSSDTLAWGVAQEVQAVTVSVDYRLAPEHPYPAAFDDCYGVLEWLAAHAPEIGGDPSRIGLYGDSAGGNLAAALSLAARDRGGPKLRAQVLIYPGMGLPAESASYRDFADGPSLTTATVVEARGMYLSQGRFADDPYAAPIRAGNFAGLPPAWVHTAGFDPIRDDGRQYAAALALAGVDVTYREAHRMLHGFMRMRIRGAQVRTEFEASCAFLRHHLAA